MGVANVTVFEVSDVKVRIPLTALVCAKIFSTCPMAIVWSLITD
jgi:hypothetical protein